MVSMRRSVCKRAGAAVLNPARHAGMAVFVADSKFAKEVGRRAFGCPEIRKKQNCLKLNSFSLPRRRKAFRPLGKPDCAIPRRAVRPSVDRTGGSWMYRSMRSLFEQVEGILARGKMFVPTEHPLAHVSRRADDGPRVAWTPASEMDPWSAELGSAPGQQAQNLFQNISPNISQNISQNFQVYEHCVCEHRQRSKCLSYDLVGPSPREIREIIRLVACFGRTSLPKHKFSRCLSKQRSAGTLEALQPAHGTTHPPA